MFSVQEFRRRILYPLEKLCCVIYFNFDCIVTTSSSEYYIFKNKTQWNGIYSTKIHIKSGSVREILHCLVMRFEHA